MMAQAHALTLEVEEGRSRGGVISAEMVNGRKEERRQDRKKGIKGQRDEGWKKEERVGGRKMIKG